MWLSRSLRKVQHLMKNKVVAATTSNIFFPSIKLPGNNTAIYNIGMHDMYTDVITDIHIFGQSPINVDIWCDNIHHVWFNHGRINIIIPFHIGLHTGMTVVVECDTTCNEQYIKIDGVDIETQRTPHGIQYMCDFVV